MTTELPLSEIPFLRIDNVVEWLPDCMAERETFKDC